MSQSRSHLRVLNQGPWIGNPATLLLKQWIHVWWFTRFGKNCIIKKREKHLQRGVTFSKVVGLSLQLYATLIKVTFLHGCFPRFLNFANGTKSCKTYHMYNNPNFTIYTSKRRQEFFQKYKIGKKQRVTHESNKIFATFRYKTP